MTIDELAARDTQTGRLCNRLLGAYSGKYFSPEDWCGALLLLDYSHTTALPRLVGDLRKLLPLGWDIENKLVQDGRRKLSYYRLRRVKP